MPNGYILLTDIQNLMNSPLTIFSNITHLACVVNKKLLYAYKTVPHFFLDYFLRIAYHFVGFYSRFHEARSDKPEDPTTKGERSHKKWS